ncbi:MAG: DUF4412 domain-containing protein [Flavobacteriales bacterium]|nr:DUF4412 domain-containing protein [Flavobacteriales bacterium]
MRSLLLTATMLCTVAMNAQDLEQLMRQALENGGKPAGITFEKDDTPYEPLGWTGSFTMEVHSFKDGAEEEHSPISIDYTMTDDKMAFHPVIDKESGDMRTIFDLKEKHMYTLIDNGSGQRTAMKMNMMRVNVDAMEEPPASNEVKIERTAETKTIDGHACNKYIAVTEDGRSEAWVAEGVAFDLRKAFGRMVSGNKAQDWQRMPFEGGLVMEMTYEKREGNEKIVTYTRDLKVGEVDRSVFDISGYQVQDMTALPMFGH